MGFQIRNLYFPLFCFDVFLIRCLQVSQTLTGIAISFNTNVITFSNRKREINYPRRLDEKLTKNGVLLNEIKLSATGRVLMIEGPDAGKFQLIKFAKRSCWLNIFITKSKSILTKNVIYRKCLEAMGPFKRSVAQFCVSFNRNSRDSSVSKSATRSSMFQASNKKFFCQYPNSFCFHLYNILGEGRQAFISF